MRPPWPNLFFLCHAGHRARGVPDLDCATMPLCCVDVCCAVWMCAVLDHDPVNELGHGPTEQHHCQCDRDCR
jgi:hypothetical protein